MAEPTGTLMPTAYDDNTTLVGDQIDQRNFELASGVNSSVQTIPVIGALGDIDAPIYILFTDTSDEIIFAEGISGSDFINCVRGARGTTAAAHTAGAGMSMIISGQQLNMFREGVIAGQKFKGLVGLDASKAGSPVQNQVYFATDTKKLYVCITAGSWEWSGNRDDHADLDDLGSPADDHTAYHTEARKITWHDNLSGDHVTGGDTHDHGQSATLGAGRVQNGLASARSTVPTYTGEIYYETDTGLLYISKGTATSGDWVKLVGAPVDAIAAYRETDITTEYGGACPPGWTRHTDFDDRLAKGAPTGVVSPLNTGGTITHTHNYTDIPQHTHPITAQTANFVDPGTHGHSIYVQGSGGPAGIQRATNQSLGTNNTENAGSHPHTFDVDLHSSTGTKRTSDDADGIATGTSETGSSWPSFQEVIWCKKT